MRVKSIFTTILIFGLLGTNSLLKSQSIIQKFSEDKRTKKDKEMIFELNALFQKVNNDLKIDFNHADTLYIIRGLDVTNRSGTGFIWNKYLKIKYSDIKKWENQRLISSDPTINLKTDSTTWYEFDDLIPLIERWDSVKINKYVDNHGEVLGVIYFWSIYRLVKNDSDYKLDDLRIRDFGLIKKEK